MATPPPQRQAQLSSSPICDLAVTQPAFLSALLQNLKAPPETMIQQRKPPSKSWQRTIGIATVSDEEDDVISKAPAADGSDKESDKSSLDGM